MLNFYICIYGFFHYDESYLLYPKWIKEIKELSLIYSTNKQAKIMFKCIIIQIDRIIDEHYCMKLQLRKLRDVLLKRMKNRKSHGIFILNLDNFREKNENTELDFLMDLIFYNAGVSSYLTTNKLPMLSYRLNTQNSDTLEVQKPESIISHKDNKFNKIVKLVKNKFKRKKNIKNADEFSSNTLLN